MRKLLLAYEDLTVWLCWSDEAASIILVRGKSYIAFESEAYVCCCSGWWLQYEETDIFLLLRINPISSVSQVTLEYRYFLTINNDNDNNDHLISRHIIYIYFQLDSSWTRRQLKVNFGVTILHLSASDMLLAQASFCILVLVSSTTVFRSFPPFRVTTMRR